MRGLACVVLLSACSSHQGAYIDVHVPADVTSVALYVGDGQCTSPKNGIMLPCNAITPENEMTALPTNAGTAYFHDVDATFTSAVTGGVAHFHLEAAGRDDTVELVAVGFTGDPASRDATAVKVMDGVRIPASDVVDVQTTLDPAAPVPANEPPSLADGQYVLVWSSADAPGECLLVEQWSNGKVQRTFIVPQDDQDCDGLTTLDEQGNRNPLECDPLWFMRQTPIEQGKSDCATFVANQPSLDVCMLGGPACVDNQGIDAARCAPLSPTYCLPRAACGAGCTSGGPIGACVQPLYHCTLTADASGNPCGATSTTIDFAPMFGGSTRHCSDVAFGADTTTDFDSSSSFVLPGLSVEIDDTVDTSASACTVDLQWKTGALDATATKAVVMLADLKVDVTGNHLLVPVLFSLSINCANGTPGLACSLMTMPSSDETELSCAK